MDRVTDDPLISTTAIDTVTLDPNNHNTIYAGTGDLNYGSFSMGSQGILKSTDAGAHLDCAGRQRLRSAFPEPAGQFPQYQAVGKVRVDPNNSNKVVAGTKTGLYFSYDGGANWTGPCLTNVSPRSARTSRAWSFEHRRQHAYYRGGRRARLRHHGAIQPRSERGERHLQGHDAGERLPDRLRLDREQR